MTSRLPARPALSAVAACAAASLLMPPAAAGADGALTLTARLANSVMKSGGDGKNYLRIGLDGCKPEPDAARTPVNVAFVIDRSWSMLGERLDQARAAAAMAVDRLAPTDIASVIVFSDRSQVILPAQPVINKELFKDAIAQIGANGSTALYDGVTTGADEVRKFKDARHFNRVVLLSDGMANVGPVATAAFRTLGGILLSQGISVTTIGLGADYNEDIMLQLARASDGNHAFAKAPADLTRIFNREFDDALTSCAQMVSVDVDLKPGWRFVRALSRDGEIDGQHARFRLNQVYAATEHYVLVEVEGHGDPSAQPAELGHVRIAYTTARTGAPQTAEAAFSGRFSSSDAEVKAGEDAAVMASVVEQETRQRTEEAIALRDGGRNLAAAALFSRNAADLAAAIKSNPAAAPALMSLQDEYAHLRSLSSDPSQWNVQRKALRAIDARNPVAAAPRY
jgi:Ca-activated chloride channel family protein